MDIYLAPTAANEELGSADQPFAATDTQKFDALMRQHAQRGNHVHLADGHYKTAGVAQWNRRPGRGFTVNGQITLSPEATVELDVDALLPEDVVSEPQYLFMGQGVWDDPARAFDEFRAMAPRAVFDALPREQAMRGGTLIGNHSKLVERFKTAGHSLTTGAVHLHGHNAAIEGTKLLDFGAYRHSTLPSAEGFPLCISAASSGFDQWKLALLGPDYLVDQEGEPSHISGTTFDGYVPEASNDQVTVRMINGSFGIDDGTGNWSASSKGRWAYLWRKDCYQENNVTRAFGKNLVQAHCNYLAKSGRIRGNKSYGADVLCYWDFLQTEGQLVELNEAYDCRDGIVIQLSPTPVGLARDFYIKDFTIGLNKIEASGTPVLIRPFAAEWIEECRKAGVPASPNTRAISGIKVDRSLKAHNEGVPVIPTGADVRKRKGCFR